MQAPFQAALGPLTLRLATEAYLDFGEIPGDRVQFETGESATSCLIGGRRVLFFDHRSAPGRLARTEIWVIDGPTEGGLAALCVACDALRPAVADGGWDALQRHIADLEAVPAA